MNILITFELGDIPIYAVDLMRLLKARGHSICLYCQSKYQLTDPNGDIKNVVTILDSLPEVSFFDVWMYDISTWETKQSPFIKQMNTYKGHLVCINYEDGYGFFTTHITDFLIEKTKLYMNNALYKDHDKYDYRYRNKVMLTPSYIGNSQCFKNLIVPFKEKQKRAIFTGNITGFIENKNPEELKCRILVPMALINANMPCYYRIYSSDPGYKNIYDSVLPEYKGTHLSWPDFLSETSNSMVILSLRGNGYTLRRFFEGIASGGLIFSTKFDHMVNFIGQGIASEHYVEIDWSGSDVVEKMKYYFEHMDEAEQIAANGRKLWEEYSMLDENMQLPKKVSDDIIDQAKKISGIDF